MSGASRAAASLLGGLLLLLVLPSPASAHGVQGRADTPVPIGAFFVAAAVVVVVSFLALGRAWARPRFVEHGWRPVPDGLSRAVLSVRLRAAVRLLVVLALALVLVAASVGSTVLTANIAPVTVFVVWWVGLVPLALLCGNAWREVNPWATLARAVQRIAPARSLVGAGGDGPAERPGDSTAGRPYPPSWGLWPSAGVLAVWGWLELVYPTAGEVRVLAVVVGAYTVVTVAGMLRYGVDAWLDHAEAFTVFSALVASLSPVEVRTVEGRRVLGLRAPAVAASSLPRRPGLVAVVSVLIGTVTFDGLSGTDVWRDRDAAASGRLVDLGLDPLWAGQVAATLGLAVMVALAAGAFLLASGAARGWLVPESAPAPGRRRTAAAFAHSLVPIVVGYHVAHYFTLFVFQSQDLVRLASDPLGRGWDLLGTADHEIDFTVVSPNVIWAVQLLAIVGGHVLGLVLAHDRAVELAPDLPRATRSQYPVLVLMVVLTVSGLWFLSEGMSAS